jgi:flagellar hook-associated protein 3 FlgL|tara:strand:+ start:227 stop:1507 length:1281 start_codon:yes stop_codon:yes gene_type:complete
MQVSTKLFNQQQLQQFSSTTEKLQNLQNKISSGQNILKASDDPIGSVQLSGLNVVKDQIVQFERNVDAASDRINLLDKNLINLGSIMLRAQELVIQASSDTLGASDRETIALEVDEMKKEILSVANAQDSNGSFLFSGYKTSTIPFVEDISGKINYKGDRGLSSLSISESRVIETTLDGGTLFQAVKNPSGKNISIFLMLEDISNSIRTASGGVEALKASGTAELTFQNKDPGTWTFDLTGNLGTQTITAEITGEDPSEFVKQINLSSTGITATINDDGKTIKLTDTTNSKIEIKNLSVYGINSAQKDPTSFFTVQPQDGAGNSIGKLQKLYDNNQLPSKQIDNIASTQVHISNNRGAIGARSSSLLRQTEFLADRRLAVEKDVADINEADLAELVTNLQSMLTSMQASQQSFVKISQLNLFDYIR